MVMLGIRVVSIALGLQQVVEYLLFKLEELVKLAEEQVQPVWQREVVVVITSFAFKIPFKITSSFACHQKLFAASTFILASISILDQNLTKFCSIFLHIR